MAVTLKILKFAALTSSTTGADNVISSGSKAWLIKTLCLHNNGTGQSITVDVSVKQAGGATPRYIYRGYVITDTNQLTIDQEITLNQSSPADSLTVTAKSTSGTPGLDCVVSGIERDQ